jgi:hypothetical protein
MGDVLEKGEKNDKKNFNKLANIKCFFEGGNSISKLKTIANRRDDWEKALLF